MTVRHNSMGLVAVLAGILSASCTTWETSQETVTEAEARMDAVANRNGFSGLAQLDESTYLAVHDELAYEDGSRLSLIRMEAGTAPAISTVRIDNWLDPDGQSSDLESVCAIRPRPNQFILAESGYWEGQYGRLFHIELDVQGNRARVLGVAKLPIFLDNNRDQTGDQFEGLECADIGDDAVLLILGERGGSDSYRSGRLRWGVLNLTEYVLTFSADGGRGIELNAPGKWSDGTENRDISALYLDGDGTLWAAAAEDPGDLGPFYSVIYEVGTIGPDPADPIHINQIIDIWKEVPGFKVEALSGPFVSISGSTLSFGTEDELYGGVLRFL